MLPVAASFGHGKLNARAHLPSIYTILVYFIVIPICLICALLIFTHPDDKSLLSSMDQYGDTFVNRSNTHMECKYYLLFSLCKSTLPSTGYSIFSSRSIVQHHIGIFYKWWNFYAFWDGYWPFYHSELYCNYRGLYSGYDRCLCLPSWHTDSHCGHPVKHFVPILFDSLGWLDILLLSYISIWLLWFCAGYLSPWMNAHFTCSWWNVFTQGRFWTLMTSSSVSHPSLSTLVVNIFQLYQLGPWLLSRLGSYESHWFVSYSCLYYFGSSLFISLCTIIYYKWKGYSLRQFTHYGASAIWLSVSGLKLLLSEIVMSTSSPYVQSNYTRRASYIISACIIPLAKSLTSQSLIEMCLFGESNFVGNLSGIAYAYIVKSIWIDSTYSW